MERLAIFQSNQILNKSSVSLVMILWARQKSSHIIKLIVFENYIYGEIKTRFNCAFNSLFAIDGVEERKAWNLTNYWDKPNEDCENKYPVSLKVIMVKSNGTQFHFSISAFSSLEIAQIRRMNTFAFILKIGGALASSSWMCHVKRV